MIDPLRRTLTQLGALAAHPLAFLILVTYGVLWFLRWHGVAKLTTT
jgi:hypothetical protein